MAFCAATDLDASFASVAKRFRARCMLGFEDELSELPVLVEFSFACALFGKRRTGLKVLALAQSRLADSKREPSSAFVQDNSRVIDKCSRMLHGVEAGGTN